MEPEVKEETIPSLHHLMRVRIRTTTFDELKKIAKDESDRSGEYTSVSDLVRVAITNWIRTHQSRAAIKIVLQPPKEVKMEKEIQLREARRPSYPSIFLVP